MSNLIIDKAAEFKEKGKHNAFDLAMAMLDTEDPTENALWVLIEGIRSVKCAFCFGLGHHSGNCNSKRALDRACENIPVMKILWGTLKAQYKSTGKKTGAVLAGSIRLRRDKKEIEKALVATRASRQRRNGVANDTIMQIPG